MKLKLKRKCNIINLKLISFILVILFTFSGIFNIYAIDGNQIGEYNDDIGTRGIDETVAINGDNVFDYGYMQGLVPIMCVKVSVKYKSSCRYYSVGTGPVNKQLTNHYVDTVAKTIVSGHSLDLGITLGRVYNNGTLTTIKFSDRDDSIYLPPNYLAYYLGYCGKTYTASGSNTHVMMTVSMSCTDPESAVYPFGGVQSFNIDF
nr:hypothetical protein [Sedimentibacter sp.]